MKVLIVGAGWTGATVANILNQNGVEVLVVEKENIVGGHSRSSTIKNVVWEPYGAHIFHTSNDKIAKFVNHHGMIREYEHKVITQIKIDQEEKYLSWPPQIEELKKLPNWNIIESEISDLPSKPIGENFVDYIVSMMGKTLYEMFIEGYSIKQWGENLHQLSSSFAPKRIELRSDGYTRLFRDKYEYFHPEGVTPIIQSLLSNIEINFTEELNIENISSYLTKFDHIVLTCPLDSFMGVETLKWRGIGLEPKYYDLEHESEVKTLNYVINYPSLDVPYVRTVETKHATGQKIKGTVVAKEYTGTPERHYPIVTTDNKYEKINDQLKTTISKELHQKVSFAGRLANYTYINQDQAIADGFHIAEKILNILK
jgi:UDP-galactopyranose mutase